MIYAAANLISSLYCIHYLIFKLKMKRGFTALLFTTISQFLHIFLNPSFYSNISIKSFLSQFHIYPCIIYGRLHRIAATIFYCLFNIPFCNIDLLFLHFTHSLHPIENILNPIRLHFSTSILT